MKLTARLTTQAPRLRVLIEKHASSTALEVQTRSVEFGKMFKYDAMRVQWMDRMPGLNPDPVSDAKPIINGGAGGGDDLLDLSGPEPELVVPPLNAVNVLDDLLGGITVASNAAPGSANANSSSGNIASGGGGGGLLDLLGGSPANPQATVTPMTVLSPLPPMQVYKHASSGVHVLFYFNKGATGTEGVATEVTAVFVNPGSGPVNGFNLQAAVPKYLVLKMEPASSSVLPAVSGTVFQRLSVTNTMHGVKPVIMRIKVGFSWVGEGGGAGGGEGGVRVDDQAEVNFPALP